MNDELKVIINQIIDIYHDGKYRTKHEMIEAIGKYVKRREIETRLSEAKMLDDSDGYLTRLEILEQSLKELDKQ